jgi:DNA replication factor GINS
MNLDELQSVQARERQSSDLQHLRSSFYREVGEFIEELNDERARVVESADDPFSEPEVRRLTDDIETAESTVEAIYERRVGKVVKKASIAAAGMPVEEDGLTSEEAALFETLVTRIEQNRETVLSVLDGGGTTVSCSIDEGSESASAPPTDDGPDPAETEPSASTDGIPAANASPDATDDGVAAADLMGGADSDTGEAAPDSDLPTASADRSPSAGSEADASPTETAPAESAPDAADDRTAPTPEPPADVGADDPTAAQAGDSRPDTDSTPPTETVPGLPRTTVRITADVGEIVGADDRDYDLGTEDVVTLPEPNADVLVEKNAAERL